MTLVERLLTADPSARASRSPESRGARAEHEDEAPAASHRGTPRSGSDTASRPESLLGRLQKNVWFPVASKALGTVFVLLGLAGIGAYAASRGPLGHAVSLPERTAGSSPWIATQAGALAAPAAPPAARPNDGAATASAAERVPPPSHSGGARGASDRASGGVLADGRVVLNRATAEDLRHLPGVGQKRAEAILALREKLGGKFRRFTDLMRVRGIGPKRLKQMLPKMVLDPPAESGAGGASGGAGGKPS